MGVGETSSNIALQNSTPPVVTVEFEVYGIVQGVYFTKYCKDRANELCLGGWVKNSKRGTIVGKLNGPKPFVEEMVTWLTRVGSPGSKIERCELTNFEYLARQEFKNFSIRF
ncbi:acylphosphatase-2 [Nilaparvata lugens]|uniref:acylphosphatase-2 n=1 Tax=Nilaparvata lugens TaxID=108931 RepID=UPI000B97DF36|nr:acylphosphatase-2 [Nilaparvata lugens]